MRGDAVYWGGGIQLNQFVFDVLQKGAQVGYVQNTGWMQQKDWRRRIS